MYTTKKRWFDGEARKFQKQWTEKYFFVVHAEKALCLLCKKSIPLMKDFKLKKDFEKIA